MTERIEKLKEISGIKLANCHSCACSSQDRDGDYGEIYCGMKCQKRPGEYLEDQDIDLNEEHDCWEPEFWATETPSITFDPYKVDGEMKQFDDAVKAINKQFPPPKIEVCKSTESQD